VLHGLDTGGPDRSVEAALRPSRRSKAGRWAARYVEGFHAGDLAMMSVRSLARSERGEASGSSGAARILSGYGAVVSALAEPLHGPLVDLRYRAIARELRWEPGQVTVTTSSDGGAAARFSAPAAIVAVPLGVLQSPDSAGGLRILPEPDAWRDAGGLLRMGDVLRLVLQFRRVPWPPDLGFLHVPGARLPTWWTPAPVRAPIITAWAGGPSATSLLALDRQALAATALDVLAPAIGVSRQELGGLLVETYHHDWSADPFARGAYSYACVGGAEAFEALGAPVAGTLVAAGEATAGGGDNGTVQGAIASGWRAARALLAA
jgi:monoamine oxidase